MRKCPKCKIEKEDLEFCNKSSPYCKICQKEYNKEYYKKRKDYFTNYSKEYYQNNKEYRKEYSIKNREHINDYYEKYIIKKPRKEYNRKYHRERGKTDNIFCLNRKMTTMISETLKGKKNGRKWQELVGYNAEDLIKHLESKFEQWMNWDNYGIYEEGKFKWHIDHIKPKSLFNYTCPEDKEFKECWALENLQPLEAIANIKKSNKYNY